MDTEKSSLGETLSEEKLIRYSQLQSVADNGVLADGLEKLIGPLIDLHLQHLLVQLSKSAPELPILLRYQAEASVWLKLKASITASKVTGSYAVEAIKSMFSLDSNELQH